MTSNSAKFGVGAHFAAARDSFIPMNAQQKAIHSKHHRKKRFSSPLSCSMRNEYLRAVSC